MAEIITRTFEMSLGHRFRLYAELMAGRARREAEAARVAPATVVAATDRALRTQASAAVRERARPAVAPSPFRALRPGDRIVTPPSLTPTIPTSTTPTPITTPHGPEPVAAILDRRQTAVARMAAWHRGDGPAASAARNVNSGAAPVPVARAITRAEPEQLADLFARRRAVVKAARPYMED